MYASSLQPTSDTTVNSTYRPIYPARQQQQQSAVQTLQRNMPPNAGEVARPQSPLRGVTPQSPLRIKQDGKFYERLLTKESAAANRSSFRYYWAEPGSVPFVWETQPGTPRDAPRVGGGGGALVPAITPPPSYLLRLHGGGNKAQAAAACRHPKSKAKGRSWCRLRRIKVGFIAGMFRRLALGKAWCRRSAPPSSSSRWLFSSVATDHHQQPQPQRRHHDEQEPATRKGAELCARARLSPWMLRFRGLVNRNRDDGWA